MKRIRLTIIVLLFLKLSFAENFPYSYDPPSGLKPENVPCFIVMGFDDCQYPDGIKWVIDTLLNKKNPIGNNNLATFDGSPLYASFYLTSIYGEDDPETANLWKLTLSKGHEIGCHTKTHGDNLNGTSVTQQTWATEMKDCNDWLIKNLGIQQSDIWGFRTPFLAVSKTSFTAENSLNFVYDCSVMHSPKDYDWIFIWPYTLDKDLAPDAQKKLGSFPGMWEIPVYNVVEEEMGFPNMCGMDYSMWDQNINADTFLKWLKLSLDIRIKSGKNRAPFALGMHPDLYAAANNDIPGDWAANLGQRKKTIIDFITYALTKPMVRFVSGKQLITWMRNPVGLDGTSGTKQPGVQATDKRFCIQRVFPDKIRLTIPSEGIYSVKFYSVSGKQVSTLAHGYLGAGEFTVSLGREKIPAGIYMLRVSGKQGALEKRISIY